MLFDLSIALRLCHDLFKVTVPTPRSRACETWVPLGPEDHVWFEDRWMVASLCDE
jgi:hypothetical protein